LVNGNEKASLIFDSTEFSHGYFKVGAINYSESNRLVNVKFDKSIFKDINSTNGPIIQVEKISKNYSGYIRFSNVIFEDIVAKDRGGIIFSVSEYTNKIVIFDGCEFKNVKAKYGNIILFIIVIFCF